MSPLMIHSVPRADARYRLLAFQPALYHELRDLVSDSGPRQPCLGQVQRVPNGNTSIRLLHVGSGAQ